MYYNILTMIDDEMHVVSTNVADDELEGELQYLVRKHEFKNSTRFDIVEVEDVKND